MNPYKKYLSLDYEKLSELEMMKVLNGVFEIADKSSDNSDSFYKVMSPIIMTSLKLKYKTVCDELRKVYPLSMPMLEKTYPKMPFEDEHKIESMSNLAPPIPVYPETEEDKKILAEINALAKSFHKMNCKCGKEITLDEIDYSNGCNEEGEDCYDFSFKCSKCGLEVEGYGWGDVGGDSGTTSMKELIGEVHDKIHGLN